MKMEEVNIVVSELVNPNQRDRRHCAIHIFGQYYEYGPNGVTVGLNLNECSESVAKCSSGFTGKSVHELDAWNNGWVVSAFDPGWNDCWHYAEATCKFLGVKFPVEKSYRRMTITTKKLEQEMNNNC